uniref:Uncharacterized protein n=1 Tax=Mycena chlorophos TaxID=658473 RepID=A0ABQ0L3K1_MYCCL|nr:predicted protein [Mycena chlorophos]
MPTTTTTKEQIEWTAGDTLGKALALVKQVSVSMATAFLKKCCRQAEVPELALKLWIRKRWGSMYAFLDWRFAVKNGLDLFLLVADTSDEVPRLRNKDYGDYRISRDKWTKLEIIKEVLREIYDVTQTFSIERSPTIWRILPTFEFLIAQWETMRTQAFCGRTSTAQQSTLSAYFICLVLDPNVKDLYFRAQWGVNSAECIRGMKQLEEMFDHYKERVATLSAPTPSEGSASTQSRPYGSAFLADAINSIQQQQLTETDAHAELRAYLGALVEDGVKAVQFWGRNTGMPVLRAMMQLSSDPRLALERDYCQAQRAGL